MATEQRGLWRKGEQYMRVSRSERENFVRREKMSKVRTLVVDDAHVLEAGERAHELEKFRRISILYSTDCLR